MRQIEKTVILDAYYESYYEELYKNPEAIDMEKAAEIVEEALDKVPAVRKAFKKLVKFRKDALTSDREYTAFLLAYNDAEKAVQKVDKKERERARKRREYRKQYGDFVGDVLYMNEIRQANT